MGTKGKGVDQGQMIVVFAMKGTSENSEDGELNNRIEESELTDRSTDM